MWNSDIFTIWIKIIVQLCEICNSMSTQNVVDSQQQTAPNERGNYHINDTIDVEILANLQLVHLPFRKFLAQQYANYNIRHHLSGTFDKIWQDLQLTIPNVHSLLDLLVQISVYNLNNFTDEKIFDEVEILQIILGSYIQPYNASNSQQSENMEDTDLVHPLSISKEMLNEIVKLKIFSTTFLFQHNFTELEW